MGSLEDAAMRNDKWTKLNELRGAGSRRILEAITLRHLFVVDISSLTSF
jgi:hypothetical protein